jgi:hypothetical protein
MIKLFTGAGLGIVQRVFQVDPSAIVQHQHPAVGRDDGVWDLPS